MSWFSRLFSKEEPQTVPLEPSQLRDRLLAACGDSEALHRLCVAHRAEIVERFDGWRNVPLEIREAPDRVQGYVNGLVAVAQVFAERFADPTLMQLLVGAPDDNPILRWQQRLGQAGKLAEELRYREAAEELTNLLIDVRGMKGTGADAYLPVTLGQLGECLFQSGQAARALAPTQQALDLVRRAGDAEGIRAYLGNLYEMHRYLDQPGEAARYAEQLAEQFEAGGNASEARRYRNQAHLVRAGEPRNRVVLEIEGRRYELEEVLQGIQGQVRFLFERNKMTLRPAEELTRRGEAAGSKGQFDQALALFREAAQADPLAPHPAYESAVTLMHLERISEAIEEYARTEELAPGWFHCRSEAWLAEQIALGRYEPRTFLMVRVLEDGGLGPLQQRQLLEQALQLAPDLPILHLLQGKSLRSSPLQAISACRRGLACADEPDVRTRLLVDLAGLLEPGPERRLLLDEAIALSGNLVAAATARILLQFGD